MQLRKRANGTLFLDYYTHGRRVREAIGLRLIGDRLRDRETMRLAEAILARRSLDMAARAHDAQFSHSAAPEFYAYASRLIAGKGRSRASVLITAVNRMRALYPAPLPMDKVSRSMIERYRDYLLEEMEATSARTLMQAIRHLFTRAVRERAIPSSPAEGVEPIPPQRDLLKDVLTADEVARLSSTRCRSDVVRRQFLLSCMTGLRRVDLVALLWSDVDLSARRVRVTQVKTGRVVWVPLNDSAVDLLGPAGVGRVFPWSPALMTVKYHLDQWVKRAGITKHITFGCARHTFVTLVLANTGNLKLASSLAGHSSITTTERYAHVVDRQRRDAVDGLPRV